MTYSEAERTDAKLVRGGTVIDGSGSPSFRGDVAIRNGVIIAVGDDACDALAGVVGTTVVDATGCVVSPGFIDIHTHYDAQIFWDPRLSPSCWHGVTTVVMGNCGFGIAPSREENRDLLIGMLCDLEDMPRATLEATFNKTFDTFGEYLDAVVTSSPLINVAAYVGHSALRIDVMGAQAYERAATDVEVELMRVGVFDSLKAGAIGLSSSAARTGRRCPTKEATASEIVSLYSVLGDLRAGVGAFNPGGEISHEFLYELQTRVRRPFTYTALLCDDAMRHEALVALHREGWENGAEVHPQVSCRALVAQMTMMSPFALRCPAIRELDDCSESEREALLRTTEWRRTAIDQLPTSSNPPQWNKWLVAESAHHPELEGQRIADLARHRGVHPFDLVLDLSLDDRMRTRFTVVLKNDDEGEVVKLLALEGAILGITDAGAHPDQISDYVLPTDLLGGWVRERAALSLEHAIYKLTGEPAAIFGFTDRGRVAVGAAADLVVFDPETIAPGPTRRVNDMPAHGERLISDSTVGIHHVLVNGLPICADGRWMTDQLGKSSGRVLRGAAFAGERP